MDAVTANTTLRPRPRVPAAGVEAQSLNDGGMVEARSLNPRLDPLRSPREMAIAWAHEERRMIEG
jgi:hypothetical protein